VSFSNFPIHYRSNRFVFFMYYYCAVNVCCFVVHILVLPYIFDFYYVTACINGVSNDFFNLIFFVSCEKLFVMNYFTFSSYSYS
jgi:hypothetical protein